MGYAGQWIVERSAEELLLEYERTGRPEPFEEIVRRYSGMVYHVCHRICRDKHDAEDATQAVFAALAVGRKEGSGEIRTIGPWLRQVARRVSLDIRRGKKRRQRRETLCATDGSSADPRPEPSTGGLDAEEVKQLVKEELERLPMKYRLPLILHYFGGMSQEDMAKELGCRPGTLRVRLHRGRGMLARRLSKRGVAVGGMTGAVVLAVAMTRAVQSVVTDSLAVQFGYGHAATAGGVIQAATSGPLAVAHGVATATKVKVGLALLVLGACVVRAGAEVYQYIRPMQMRVPVPVNMDRIMRPLFDTFTNPMRVDATPPAARPEGVGETDPSDVAITDVPAAGPVLAPRPAASPPARRVWIGEPGRVVGLQGAGVDGNATVQTGQGTGPAAVGRPPGLLSPEYSRPMVWKPPAGGGSFGGGGGSGTGAADGPGATSPVAERTPAPKSPKPPKAPTPGTKQEATPESMAAPPVAEVPPKTRSIPSTPPNPSPNGGGMTGGNLPVAVASAITLGPTARVEMPNPSSGGPPPSGGGTPSTGGNSSADETPPPPSSTGGTMPITTSMLASTSATGTTHWMSLSLTSDSDNSTPSGVPNGVSYSYVSASTVVPVVGSRQTFTLWDSSHLASRVASFSVGHTPVPSVVPLWQSSSVAAAPVVSTPKLTFRVEEQGITGYGVVSASSLDNNGIVRAMTEDGAGVEAQTLDLSQVGQVTNTIDNPPNARNGWYAGSKAKLVLPGIKVEPGTHAYSWGEDPADATPDLVNGVRLTLHDVTAPGEVELSLVAPDWPGVPALPSDQRAIGLWAVDLGALDLSGIDLLIRFDAYQAYLLEATDEEVRLLDFGPDGWQAVDDGSFFIAPAEHLLGGHVGDVAYFAVTVPRTATPATFSSAEQFTYSPLSLMALPVTPEPTGVGVAAGGMFLLLSRRRQR